MQRIQTTRNFYVLPLLAICLLILSPGLTGPRLLAQEEEPVAEKATDAVADAAETTTEAVADAAETTKEAVADAAETIEGKVEDIAAKVDESEKAKAVSAGILTPIYTLAEAVSFSGMYWVAFAVMATGVVSFALQLTLGKLAVLARMSFSLTEILSDALGLVISLAGLVLTTQAATENSSFPESPAAVLSASVVGLIAGAIFYWFGQRQELEAAKGRQRKK